MRWRVSQPFRPTATRSLSVLEVNILVAMAFTPCSLEANGRSALRQIQGTAVRHGPLTVGRLHSPADESAPTPFTLCPHRRHTKGSLFRVKRISGTHRICAYLFLVTGWHSNSN